MSTAEIMTRMDWLKVTARQAVVFGLVGVVNTTVDFTAFYLVFEHVYASILVANVCGWLISVQLAYVLHSQFSFRDPSRSMRLAEYGRFTMTAVVVLVTNTIAVYLLALIVPVYWAKLLATAVSFATNFTLSKFVVFRRK